MYLLNTWSFGYGLSYFMNLIDSLLGSLSMFLCLFHFFYTDQATSWIQFRFRVFFGGKRRGKVQMLHLCILLGYIQRHIMSCHCIFGGGRFICRFSWHQSVKSFMKFPHWPHHLEALMIIVWTHYFIWGCQRWHFFLILLFFLIH